MLRNINRPTLAQLVERLTVDVITFVKKSNQIVACSIQASRNILFNTYFLKYLLNLFRYRIMAHNIKIHQ